jgi:hypothetical protein
MAFTCKSRTNSTLSVWARTPNASLIFVDSYSCLDVDNCVIYLASPTLNRFPFAVFDMSTVFTVKLVAVSSASSRVTTLFSSSSSVFTTRFRQSGWQTGNSFFGARNVSYKISHLQNNGFMFITDTIDSLIMRSRGGESYTPPRIIVINDTLSFMWNPRRRVLSDAFTRIVHSNPFCWVDIHCPEKQACLRPQCVNRASNCVPPAPTPLSFCTTTGWAQNGNLLIDGSWQAGSNSSAPSSAPIRTIVVISSPLQVTGNINIEGNVTLRLGSTSATITATGCFIVSGGSLILNVTSEASNLNVTVITFEDGYCEGNKTRFESVRVDVEGAPPCEQTAATAEYYEKSIAVIYTVDRSGCSANATPDGLGTPLWIIGPIVGGIIALLAIILIIVFLLRKRVIPSYRMEAKAEELHKK